MSRRLLLQSILKFSDSIKSGTAKVQDVVEDYFKSSGKQPTEEERAIIMNEFAKDAPSGIEAKGVEEVFFGPGDTRLGGSRGRTEAERLAEEEGVDVAETILPTRPFTDLVEQERGVKLRGDESFGELMEKLGPAKKEGLGSLFPKGETDSIFDIKNDKRQEVAEFIKKMRGANIENKDIRKLFKDTGGDIEQGKKVATTLARAADMKADTARKQELLSDLDYDIANYGPDWWQGGGYNMGPMGYDSYGDMLTSVSANVRNGIYDDLIDKGVDEDKVSEVFQYIGGRIGDNLARDPKALISKIVDDLEIEGIDYDPTFFNNYVDEILSRTQKPKPRFADGGVV
tara:strand:- start:251 stop:1279 length:1029 start_codon:yes stop_codon:yes gene_type:complete